MFSAEAKRRRTNQFTRCPINRSAFYITTAIDYPNATPHLGTAYEKVGADVIARWMRIAGRDVFFLMGNDEHAQKIEKRAREETEAQGKTVTPLEVCDQMAEAFQTAWKALHVSYDRFIRTTQASHHKAVNEIVRRIDAAGDIYRDTYEGHYCSGCEAFVQERDLVDGKCPTHGEVEWLSEENHFFKLSEYTDKLLAHYEAHPDFLVPERRRNEILSLLREGLIDVSFSRSSRTWGLPYPGSEEDHVCYVWPDALTNYLTGVGFPDDTEMFERYWPCDVHVVGKDITRFHCVIWPAMLMSAQIELPRQVYAHGWVSLDGAKMSKTTGTTVDPVGLVEKYGADVVRYFLMREIVWGRDGDFSDTRLEERYASDLANDLGNLFQRTISMTERYLDGVVGTHEVPADDALRLIAETAEPEIAAAYERYDIQTGLTRTWDLIQGANRYIEDNQPWKLAKEDDGIAKVAPVLFAVSETLRRLALLLFPIMPERMAAGWRALGIETPIEEAKLADLGAFGSFPAGVAVAKGDPLFPRRE